MSSRSDSITQRSEVAVKRSDGTGATVSHGGTGKRRSDRAICWRWICGEWPSLSLVLVRLRNVANDPAAIGGAHAWRCGGTALQSIVRGISRPAVHRSVRLQQDRKPRQTKSRLFTPPPRHERISSGTHLTNPGLCVPGRKRADSGGTGCGGLEPRLCFSREER